MATSRLERPCRVPVSPPTHKPSKAQTEQHNLGGWAEWQAKRGNRHQRGYGSKWEKIRARIIKRDNYLCQEHLRRGELLEVVVGNPRHLRSAHVDHIIPKARGGSDQDSNLELLCRACHERKTAADGRPRGV